VIKSQKNCKNCEKIEKNAQKLMQKKCKNARQIVKNGVDQVDLGGVGDFQKRRREKNGRGD
jgi:hypothetical protein